ncbi:hypothetical protein CAAN3_07S06524 [[Candida] anglica]
MTLSIIQPAPVAPVNNAAVNPVLTPREIFLAHFRSYPIISSTREAIYAVPITNRLAGIATPVLLAVRETQPIKAVMDRGDLIGDYTLSQIDIIFPTLTTLEVHDLTDPVTVPINGAFKALFDSVNTLNTSLGKLCVEPFASVIHGLSAQFNALVHDANGKGIVSSQFDPIFLLINNNLEALTDRCDIKTVPEEGSTSEMSRTRQIICNTLAGIKNDPIVVAEAGVETEIPASVPEPVPESSV